jgi:hypothetical protein
MSSVSSSSVEQLTGASLCEFRAETAQMKLQLQAVLAGNDVLKVKNAELSSRRTELLNQLARSDAVCVVADVVIDSDADMVHGFKQTQPPVDAEVEVQKAEIHRLSAVCDHAVVQCALAEQACAQMTALLRDCELQCREVDDEEDAAIAALRAELAQLRATAAGTSATISVPVGT